MMRSESSREDECNESTALLPQNPPHPAPSSHNAAWILILLVFCIITIDFGSFLSLAPQIQIFESIICRNLHPEIASVPAQDAIDAVCKAPDVQGELALLIGWRQMLDVLPGIVLALPYGLMADRMGRKPVLLMSLMGLMMEEVMVRIIAWYSAYIPLRAVWFMSIFQLCGGGAQIAASLVFTMVTDVFSVEKRANIFFLIYGAVLIAEIVATPLSAWLMGWTPWLPFLLGAVVETCGIMAVFMAPETRHKSVVLSEGESEDDTDGGADEDEDATALSASHRFKARLGHVWRQAIHHGHFIFGDRNIAFICIASVTIAVSPQSVQIMLQYVSKRFAWSMAKASFLVSLKGIINLTVLLLLLPAISKALDRYLPPIRRDLRISLASITLLTTSSILMALAPEPIAFAAGLSISALGGGFYAALRSVATALVAESEMALLSTTIALMQGIGGLVAGPLLASMFRYGMTLDGVWLGLPYLTMASLYAVACAATIAIRVPRRVETRIE